MHEEEKDGKRNEHDNENGNDGALFESFAGARVV